MQLVNRDFVEECLIFLPFFELEIMRFENHHQEREMSLQTFSTLRKFAVFIIGSEEISANLDLVSFFYRFIKSFE